MKQECETVEHAIWECARAGHELPAEARRHVDECAECARAANETTRILGLMSDAGSVPASADCRDAVMARISGARRRPVLVYALSSVLLLAIIVTGFYLFQGNRPSPNVAGSMPTITQEKPSIQVRESPPQVTAPEPQKVEAPKAAVQKREPGRYRTPSHKKRAPAPAPRPIIVPEEPILAEEAAPPDEPELEDDWPVAIVAVTWEAAPSESQGSYAYVQTNVETGETTTCRVQRSEGSVNIFFESKPGGDEPPEKGA